MFGWNEAMKREAKAAADACREHVLSAPTQRCISIRADSMITRCDRKQVWMPVEWLIGKEFHGKLLKKKSLDNKPSTAGVNTDKGPKQAQRPLSEVGSSLIRAHQVECGAPAWRCWCPVGVPESQCGRGVRWTRSWRRSRCPPQQPPCGTPPCPPPDGPPTASAWLGQDRDSVSGQTRPCCHSWEPGHLL